MSATKLLEGIRIVDLTTVVFGPHATQMLADLGAEVIKIEAPEGDIFRYAGARPDAPTMGACHMTLNRGKKSVALDLKNDDQKSTLRELLRTADVFIHNVRGKAIERLGFNYEEVQALKPDIVYVHCVGFGSGGPYAGLQAYDDVIQAAAGVTTLLGRVDGDSRPRYLPSLIADKVAGHYGAQAVLAALIHKLRTGEGQFVEVPMFEAFTHFMLVEHLFGAAFDQKAANYGYPRQLDPWRQPFPTSDGYISIVPYQDDTIVRAFRLMGADDLLQDDRFSTTSQRLRNFSAVYQEISKRTPARTTAEWVTMLNAAGIPAMAVRDLAQMHEDPHLKAVGFFQERNHPSVGSFLQMNSPVHYSCIPEREIGLAPEIGKS